MNIRPTRQEVLLGNRPVLEAPPSTEVECTVPWGFQDGFVPAGDRVSLVGGADLVSLDPATSEVTHAPFDRSGMATDLGALGTPDGGVVFVSNDRRQVLKAREGRIDTVAEAGCTITSPVTLTQEGAFIYGTGDGRIHSTDSDRLLGDLSRFRWASSPDRVAIGPDGTTFVGTFRGLAAFGPDGHKAIWGKEVPTARGGQLHPLLVTPGGDRVIHTGLEGAVVAFDARTGDEAWRVTLPREEGDCFNPGTLDAQGNLYTVSGREGLFKISPDGKVLWKREAGDADPQEVALERKVAIDADGNVCVSANREAFTVYSPDGVLLMDLRGDGGLPGAGYLCDFTVSPDGHHALLKTQAAGADTYTILEVGLPGPAGPLLASLPETSQKPEEPALVIQQQAGQVDIGGVRLPVRI